jgi:hypothetical protein
MNSTQVRYGGAICFALVLLFAFGAGGWQEKASHKERIFACQDETVIVDPTDGTKPKAIYLCLGKTLTWDANGHQFRVVFRKQSPFVDGGKVFDNAHPTSAAAKAFVVLTVYEYDITVDDKKVDDPQVVGGGGHGDE